MYIDIWLLLIGKKILFNKTEITDVGGFPWIYIMRNKERMCSVENYRISPAVNKLVVH